MPKILFIAIHRPGRSPSQRFRFEQYLSFLESKGWEYEFSYLISEKDDTIFYKKGHVFRKALIFLKAIFIRLNDVFRASKFDVVFIQREAFFTGTTFFEKRFAKSKAKLIFDFDDAIWLPNVSHANKKLEWLKNGGKTNKIITVSDLVIAGNQFLANYALTFNQNTIVIPTTIDLNYHKKTKTNSLGKITIGWTGTSTTLPYFDSPDFTESNIYHSFYPEKAFSKHELTRYFSKLRALLDDFFIQESLDNSPFMKGALLEKYYYELMNEAGLQKARKANLDQLKNSIPVESVNHFYTYLSQKKRLSSDS